MLRKRKLVLINLLIALCLLVMSFSFTFAYFTYQKQDSINFTAGKISFSFKNNNEVISDFTISDLVYVDYYNDVMNDKTNTLDSLVTCYDLDIVNESNVDNVSITINITLQFETEKEANAIICQIIPITTNIDDSFSYSTYFKNDYVQSDDEDKETVIEKHKKSLLNKDNIEITRANNSISFLLVNTEKFALNEVRKYRLVFLADYDEAAKNALEGNINSFSHQYNLKFKIKAGQSEEFN